MASIMSNSEVQQQLRQRQILLTARATKYLRKGMKLGQRLSCHPYVWDDAKDYPEFTTSPMQMMGWIFNFVFSVGYSAFLLVQCVRVNSSAEEHVSNKAFTIFFVILFSLPVVIHGTILTAGEQLTDYVRSSLIYCHKFEESYVQETARPSRTAKIGGTILTLLYYAIPVDAWLFIVFSVTRLNSPEQLSSMIPDYPPLQIPVSILFYVYYYGCYVANGYALVFTSFGILFAFFDVLNELGYDFLNSKKSESDFTSEALRRPEDGVRAYRVIQLQIAETDRVYWISFAAAKYILMLLSAFSAYGAIRLGGMVGFALACLGATVTIILVVFLSAWAEFYSGSLNAMESIHTLTTRADVLANKKLRTWLRKTVRSLRVARLPIGGMYYIDKELVLDAIGIISDGIFFLLVNF